MKYSGANLLTELHGDKFYAEFDKQFGLKPVEVADGVGSNPASILGGQIVFNLPPHARPHVTGIDSIFKSATIIPSVPVDTFHSKLAGGMCKSHHHNMPATIQWQIQAFSHLSWAFSPVSPPILQEMSTL